MATMSPASAVSTSIRPSLSKTRMLSIEPGMVTSPALISTAFCWRRTRPAAIRPMAIRPTYSEKSSVVQSIWNGLSGSTTGPGTCSTIMSKSGLTSPDVRVRVVRGEAGLARGEDVGEIELLLAGPLLHERVEDLVEHLGRAAHRAGRSC